MTERRRDPSRACGKASTAIEQKRATKNVGNRGSTDDLKQIAEGRLFR
jgi:hypothetical protein